MSTTALLTEMLALVRRQVEHVVAGDHQALAEASVQHEALLSALAGEPEDGDQEAVRALCVQIEREKQLLCSLLTSELQRTDYLLRVIHGGGQAKPAGYPNVPGQTPGTARMLNRRI